MALEPFPVLVDTSGIFAFLDVADVQHSLAFSTLRRAPKLFTHSYVLAELVPLAQTRGLPRLPVLDFVSTLFQEGVMEIVWVNKQLHEQAHALLLARRDKKYSLCDAVSFVLMRMRDEREALTTDRHFEQEGFVRLLFS